jgi:iron(III) transport system substrate-binding protein
VSPPSGDPADQAVVERVGIVFPNQGDRGTHVNISGAGLVATAPNKENAVKFLEFLASDQAQRYFSAGNNEFPAVPGISFDNPRLVEMGAMEFRKDEILVAAYGENQPLAQIIADEVGWK